MGTKIIQTNFTAGVLDALMAAREDTEMYYNGLAAAENLEIQPVGGITVRKGLKKIQRLKNIFSVIDLSGASASAPQGGTAANAIDGDVSTVLTTSNNLSTTNPFVVFHIDFTTAQQVDAVDVVDVLLSSGSLDDEFFVQYSVDDTAWTNYGTAFNLDTSKRTRRRAVSVSARYWRIVRIGDTDLAATVSIGEVQFFEESAALSNGRLAGFSNEDTYMHVISDRHIDILRNSDLVGAISVPYQSNDLAVLDWTQSYDTMLLFHKDYQPERIFRQGYDDEFDSRPQDFLNIPKNDYGAGTGGINEVQMLNDGGTVASGDKFTILLEGERTTTITGGASRADTATNIQTALRALDNTSSSGITVTNTTDGFEVTFGGDDGSQPWLEIDVSVLKGNSVWTVSRTTEGEYEGEDIMSDTRGWPRCGTFYQQRLFMGGCKGRGNVLLASKVSEFFDLDINTDDDTAGLFLPMDTNESNVIRRIFAGRKLEIFTSGSEFYISKEPIAADSPIAKTTRSGIKEGLRVHDMDGASIFVQGDGASLREYIYTDVEQNYNANNLSYKAGSLINNPVDVDVRRAVNADETDQLYLVNGDGTIALMCALRSQSVPGAFTKLSLDNDGKFLAVGVDAEKRIFVITERIINGQAIRFVEQFDADYCLDCASKVYMTYENFSATIGQTEFTYSFTSPATADEIGVRVNGARLNPVDYSVNLGTKTVTLDVSLTDGDSVRISYMVKNLSGIEDLDGAVVRVVADGTALDSEFSIASGALSLDEYADTSIEYGFDFRVEAELLEPRVPGQETLTGKKMRVPRVILSLYETEGIEISVNNGQWREVPLLSFDADILDKSQQQLAFTGTKDIRGIPGWGNGVVKFRRPRPGKITIRTITREVAI
ncbi:MAG: hypothetical protein IAE63_06785 [Alphaproteobacteria bacterium]|nr:hypothetical protein [Alphaproteobacteria bacterium]